MNDEMVPAPLPAATAAQTAASQTSNAQRLWPALTILGLYWGATVGLGFVEIPYFFRFLLGMAASALLFLVFNIWWWRNRHMSRLDRLQGFCLLVGGAIVVVPFTDTSVRLATTLKIGVPVFITLWMIWNLFVQRFPVRHPRTISVLLAALAWGLLLPIRIEGLDGDLRSNFGWRWTPTAEQLFLARRSAAAPTRREQAAPLALSLSPGDWPEFRGLNRDGLVETAAIETDWNRHPPKLRWKQRIGPAWSSVIVVGQCLFTQEQRGAQETVVCYDSAAGRELWVHEDEARFWESVSGVGPRATPTFSKGRIYALGATGLLNCLDGATGKCIWSHDLKTAAGAVVPMWGLSGSPLVANDHVIVYGGGENQNNLVAFDAVTGETRWTATAGVQSYSSPQLAIVDGVAQVLMLSDHGLAAFHPLTGAELWHNGVAMPGAPRCLQTHVMDKTRLVAGTLAGMSAGVVDVSHNDNDWSTTECREVKPMTSEFSDFIVHEGKAYGFDVAIFCCVDLDSGKRLWKKGRYGRGQVVFLAGQELLLVLSEAGELVLVKAQPGAHQEVARFQAIIGKTWNHPVVAHGRVYARNAEEIACYELAELPTSSSSDEPVAE